MFPVEIWEKILQHVDARSLVRLRTVCKTWNAVIERILEKNCVWYDQCIEDIPRNFWWTLLENANVNSLLFLEMYKLWWGWKNAVRSVPRIGTLEPLPHERRHEQITCVSTLDNIVAIGTTEGFVSFYDIINDKILWRADHTEFLEHVHMFKRRNHVFAVSKSVHNRTRFWNLTAKREEKHLRCTASFVTTSFDNCFVIIGRRITWYQLTRDADVRIRKVLDDDLFDCIGFEPMLSAQIIAVGAVGQTMTLWTKNSGRVERDSINGLYVANICHTVEPEANLLIRYYRTFAPRVAAYVGVFGQFGFCVDGGKWTNYDVFERFSVRVTAVMFHVVVVAIGLESGEVHIFPVKDVESLKHLDFDAMRSRKLMLDTRPIISLNAMEYDSTPYIVAATSRRVHLVKFT